VWSPWMPSAAESSLLFAVSRVIPEPGAGQARLTASLPRLISSR
jgi:hypothetical protein